MALDVHRLPRRIVYEAFDMAHREATRAWDTHMKSKNAMHRLIRGSSLTLSDVSRSSTITASQFYSEIDFWFELRRLRNPYTPQPAPAHTEMTVKLTEVVEHCCKLCEVVRGTAKTIQTEVEALLTTLEGGEGASPPFWCLLSHIGYGFSLILEQYRIVKARLDGSAPAMEPWWEREAEGLSNQADALLELERTGYLECLWQGCAQCTWG